MSQSFSNPMGHPDWIEPHSREWYDQVVSEYGKYAYPWKSEFEEPTAEMIFGRKLSASIKDKTRILDLGCGHGEFLNKYASKAKEAIGIDNVEGFIDAANRCRYAESVRFMTVDVNAGLPFSDDSFNLVYSKKGPWPFQERNGEGNRVLKPGGTALLFKHGGTDGGLRELFPHLYAPMPAFDKDRWVQGFFEQLELDRSGLSGIEIELVEETEYLKTPEDVLLKKYFGQSKRLKERAWNEFLSGVERVFDRHATPKGLKVTNYYYILTATVD